MEVLKQRLKKTESERDSLKVTGALKLIEKYLTYLGLNYNEALTWTDTQASL